MRIIISPAKKMKINTDTLSFEEIPFFIEETKVIQRTLKALSYEEAKSLWRCNDKIASYHYERLKDIDLYHNLTPAILAYEGIQYQYMSPAVFHTQEMEYIKEHLRILSGFYGLLKPFDGVLPYRLEMQAKLFIEGKKSLYDYWNSLLATQLFSESKQIVNLASVEYSKCITKYRKEDVNMVTCVFGELIHNKIVEKGTYAKMARGEMVRFMAETNLKDVKQLKKFDRLGYLFAEALSDEKTYIFLKKNTKS